MGNRNSSGLSSLEFSTSSSSNSSSLSVVSARISTGIASQVSNSLIPSVSASASVPSVQPSLSVPPVETPASSASVSQHTLPVNVASTSIFGVTTQPSHSVAPVKTPASNASVSQHTIPEKVASTNISEVTTQPNLPEQVASTNSSEVTTKPNPPMVSSSPPDHVVATSAEDAVSSAPPSSSIAPPSLKSSVGVSAVVKSSSGPGSSTPTQASVKASQPSGTAKPASTSPSGHATTPATTPTNSVAENGPKVSFTGTTTSTITDLPSSTLSKPSFIPTVEPNGKTSFTAPPLVTILSTSAEANGSFVTFTHVVANPTGFSEAISGGQATFFHDSGAVAGVFLVVGALVTAVAAFGIFILCRRRRRRLERHRRWLISINRPRPMEDGSPEPFEDPRTPPSPPMRVADHNWGIPVLPAHQDSFPGGLGLYDVPPVRRVEPPKEHYDNMGVGNEIGLAITTNHSKPSLAQSSPSIYPPTLPPADDDEPFQEPSPQSVPPPRPRRSHLRDAPSTGQLITPPSSVSSHSPVTEFASPFGFTSQGDEPSPVQKPTPLTELIGRRTLLDVRRSQDTILPKTTTPQG